MSLSKICVDVATLEELLSCHDEKFVRSAYKALFGREPDPEGLNYYLANLRAGMGKLEILAQLQMSSEGKSRQKAINALNDLIEDYQQLKISLLSRLLRRQRFKNPKISSEIDAKISAINPHLQHRFADANLRFVHSAYHAVLGRIPDTDGLSFYLRSARDGVSKIEILTQLKGSAEGKSRRANLSQLDEAIATHRQLNSPLIGFFLRLAGRRSAERSHSEYLRVIENNLHRFDKGDQQRLRAIEAKLQIFDASNRKLEQMLGTIKQAFDTQSSILQRDIADLRQSTGEIENITRSVFQALSSRLDGSQQTGEPVESTPIAASIETLPLSLLTQELILPVADGTWEWSDYSIVRERVQTIKKARRETINPMSLNLIEIGNTSFAVAASQVVLPPPGKSPEVSIILPVFNNLKLTLECLLSIAMHTDSTVTYEVLVRDDASTDDTFKIVSAIKNLRLIRNPKNIGFLLNCNSALDSVRGKYVLFLNNDVQVTKGWLKVLVDTFAQYPLAGAVGPRFVYPNGHLQEAGAAILPDGTAEMIGINEDPTQRRFSYVRRVDYTSGACLMLPTALIQQLGGFSEEFLPCYCEDSDLCLRVQEQGYFVYFNPAATIVHHLSKTTASIDNEFKFRCVSSNLSTLANKWAARIDKTSVPRVLAFYLPQFHPFPENNAWWGEGFTEWTNVSKSKPNFMGQYQPRLPADLGFYDLRLPEVMSQQAELARRYGIDGFCFYYYWFGGRRLLDLPLERMLKSNKPEFPFCLCWANENWSRRWDGQDSEILMAQAHSPQDDIAVIADLSRYFHDGRYIRIDNRPLILVYRVPLFPDFAKTAERWRSYCREEGVGEIYIAMVESFGLVHSHTHPSTFGCDATVEFPPQELAEAKPPTGTIVNSKFQGHTGDYKDLAVRFATRELPPYTRFMGVAPGWDNTARMQDRSFCFEGATPGAFQAWVEEALDLTRAQHFGDERLVFVNAWNEWAEGTYLEPDRCFGHTFLEAVRNAKDGSRLLRKDKYGLGG